MSQEPEQARGGWAGWSFAGLIVIYFGFPALWIWPIWKIYGPGPPPKLFQTLAYPIAWICDHFAGYQKWVDWGFKLFGIS